MIVFIIGPAAVGKSHFCRCWQKLRPEFKRIDDLPVVLEYIELDKILISGTGVRETKEKLLNFADKSTYLKTEAEEYINILNASGNIPAPRFTKEMDGGFRAIADPGVWDEMMRKISGGLLKEKHYLVEFARGIDPGYLALHGITERKIYLKSIECFVNSLGWSAESDLGIVHIGAGCDERKKRNIERRGTTGQYLPDTVFEKVFKRDAFTRASNDLSKITDTETVLIGSKKVSVFSITNDIQKTPDNLDNFLIQAASDAMKYFGLS